MKWDFEMCPQISNKPKNSSKRTSNLAIRKELQKTLKEAKQLDSCGQIKFVTQIKNFQKLLLKRGYIETQIKKTLAEIKLKAEVQQ